MSLQRRKAWTWLARVHASRNSPAPFLYQTHTLTSIQFSTVRFHSQTRSTYSASDEPHNQAENDGPDASGDNPGEPRPPPRSSFLQRKAASVSKKKEKPRPIPWHMTTASGENKPRRPKLTPHETQTLAGLYSRIQPKERPNPVATAREDSTARETDKSLKSEQKTESEPNLADDDEGEFADISSILDSVLQNIKPRKDTKHGMADDSSDDVESSRPVLKYHGKMIYLPNSDEELPASLEAGELTLADAIELIAKRETAKIEVELKNAVRGGEEYFWEICQERVFAQAHYLRSPEDKAFSVKEAQQAGNEHTSSTAGQEESTDLVSIDDVSSAPDQHELSSQEGPNAPIMEEIFSQTDRELAEGDFTSISEPTPEPSPRPANPLDIPSCVPVHLVAVTTYQKLLREAFILLNLHFPRSPLIADYRNTIISLGSSSAIVGLSINLFTDMMYFHWRVTHDFAEIHSLICEMNTKGAVPSAATFNILFNINSDRKRALFQKRRGDVLDEPWWDLPRNRKALREIFDGKDALFPEMMRKYGDAKQRWKAYAEVQNP